MTSLIKPGCLLFCFALFLAACESSIPPPPNEPIDEASINSVWHKAKLRGVSFRAIGQEPGWLLEITTGTEILLETDYGQTRSSFPYVEPVVYQEERRTEYVLEAYGMIVEIRGEPCQDIMSGEEFSVSVTIKQAKRKLQGCGRALH
jgi:putative lipoprotein